MISKSTFKRFYPDHTHDGAVAFYSWVRTFINPDTNLLNLGAGPPANRDPIRVFKGEVAKVIGVDIDPEVKTNTELDEAYVITPGGKLPFPEETFDLVLCDWVLEHIADPQQFLSEARRVLRTGGSFFFRTPNRYHYVGLIARSTPEWFHKLVANRARGSRPGAHEPWPTFYRLNSRGDVESKGLKAGYREVEIKMWECQPAYLVFSTLPFLIGVSYERLVNRYTALEAFRADILGRMVK